MKIKKSLNIDGNGVFSTKEYKKNSIIYTLKGDILDSPTRESIHIGNNRHIIDEFGVFINHSFTPNIKIESFNLVALRDIKSDEELCFNYNDSELKMACPFYVSKKLVNGSIS